MKNILGLLLFSILLVGCVDEEVIIESDHIDVNKNTLAFNYQLNEIWENTLYPSLIISPTIDKIETEGDIDLLSFSFVAPYDNANVRIKANIGEYGFIDEFIRCEKEGEVINVKPTIAWEYEQLQRVLEPLSVSFTASIYVNGEMIDHTVSRLNVRSVNECVYAIKKEDKFVSCHENFVAYVAKNSQFCDQVLGEVLQCGVVNSFNGYQSANEEVAKKQIFAIWHYLQKNNVKYSDVSNLLSYPEGLAVQYVRLINQTINNNQANCVDGTVLFSSLLEKISMRTAIVIVPGHMYLAFKYDIFGDWYALETTMVGNLGLKNSNLSYDEQVALSWESFEAAVDYATKNFKAKKIHFEDENQKQYLMLDVFLNRQYIQPIPID